MSSGGGGNKRKLQGDDLVEEEAEDEGEEESRPQQPELEEQMLSCLRGAPPGITEVITREDIPIPSLDPKAEKMSMTKGRFLTKIDSFDPEVGSTIIDPQKRAKFVGKIVTVGMKLSETITPANVEDIITTLQPCHLGEAVNDSGSKNRHGSFVVDADDVGWFVPRELVYRIVRNHLKRYTYNDEPLTLKFVCSMSNRIWEPGSSLSDTRTVPIVPDGFYYKKFMIPIGNIVSFHIWTVCAELKFQCHPEAKAYATAHRQKKNEAKRKKKKRAVTEPARPTPTAAPAAVITVKKETSDEEEDGGGSGGNSCSIFEHEHKVKETIRERLYLDSRQFTLKCHEEGFESDYRNFLRAVEERGLAQVLGKNYPFATMLLR